MPAKPRSSPCAGHSSGAFPRHMGLGPRMRTWRWGTGSHQDPQLRDSRPRRQRAPAYRCRYRSRVGRTRCIAEGGPADPSRRENTMPGQRLRHRGRGASASSVSEIHDGDVERKKPHLSFVEIRRRLDPLELVSELLDRVGKAARMSRYSWYVKNNAATGSEGANSLTSGRCPLHSQGCTAWACCSQRGRTAGLRKGWGGRGLPWRERR